ncbi:hypothetical protein, partial [Sinorhizobium medicae]|uniref:hypothetical protein n=1 Tax=Sinorhizobium medicae TaxID=110321 RepID=UPI0027DD5344
HVFPPTMLGHAAFHQPAQRGELVRQIPALQRILSLTVGTPNIRWPPVFLGMGTARTGGGK